MRKRGATDITGCIADHYYNDKEILGDLVGDRVCDEVGYETPEFYVVLERLQEIGHPALKLAVEEILNQHPRKE